MKLYVAMIEDRHTDTEAIVFATPDAAIDHARQHYRDNVHPDANTDDDIGEHETEGWLYHATYSTEGDSVWVVETELRS